MDGQSKNSVKKYLTKEFGKVINLNLSPES